MLELKGKPVADQIYTQIQQDFKLWPEKKWSPPHLVVILVGSDPASQVYVQHKQKACEKLGYQSSLVRMPAETTKEQLTQKINDLNHDTSVDSIMLQLPLPSHLNAKKMTELISLKKDADGLTSAALGKLVTGQQFIASCTPAGIIEILKYYNIDVARKNALVIGRSQIVGLPLFHLLNQLNATVTLAHSKTENLIDIVKNFEFVFVAVGQPHFLKASDFKKNAVVVDVGIHRLDAGLTGDVDFTLAKENLLAYTPVPGGVGPMTIAMLMKNTFILAEKNRKALN
jgi:methylenetetrahydrofolate dehydrogenase (NADP+)/methenyltetrahydrofolate cyclohydrolase